MTSPQRQALWFALLSGAASSDALVVSTTPSRTSSVPVRLIEWQGCPDCTKYGDGIVKHGLKKGLGTIMQFSALFSKGGHPGRNNDPNLHAWVACSNSVVGSSDSNYAWYQVAQHRPSDAGPGLVAACANP